MELKQIKELIKLVNESKINKLKIKNKDFKISLGKNSQSAKIKSKKQNKKIDIPLPNALEEKNTAQEIDNNFEIIKAPMVGTFYVAASPNSPLFANTGDTIKKGNTIGIIEAMKIMNEIEAEFDCKIVEVLVKNEHPVEYNMPLYKVERL